MASLSKSYGATLDSLDNRDQEKASKKFKGNFVPTVKKLYAESGKVYPLRFAKVNDWCAWTKELYKLTHTTEKTLEDGQLRQARQQLDALRRHFHDLHAEAGTQKASDNIYAFLAELKQKRPDVVELEVIRAAVEKSELSDETGANPGGYKKHLAAWNQKASRILKDGKLGWFQRRRLRRATEKLYPKVGIQFE